MLANPEWGTKRQCPKCGTRFYDLGNFEPIVCIDCGKKFKPEVILKSKMTPLELTPEEPAEDVEEELDVPDESSDDAVVEADDNTTVLSDDDDTNVADVVVPPTTKNSSE